MSTLRIKIVEAINSALGDRDRFFVYTCVIAWISNVLLVYSIVMLSRLTLCELLDCGSKREALLTIASLAWQGSYVAWGIFSALCCGWVTSRRTKFMRYFVAAFLGILVCGIASTVITWKLGFPEDIMNRWHLAALFIVLGPTIFAATAKLTNLIYWKDTEDRNSWLVVTLGTIASAGTAMKWFIEVSGEFSR